MTGQIVIVLHSESSTPGRVGMMLRELGFRLDIRRPCLGDPLPESLEHHDGAVIFGGPMSANDSDEYLRREIDWIAVPLAEKKPFLGICLGAQMLAKQLGGEVGPHPDGLVEIGYYPLRPLPAAARFGDWPETVYHWHREGFSLPRGAEALATGETFENQAFRYGACAFGLQFHPEVTRLTMHRWTISGAHRFVLKGAKPAHEHLNDQLVHDAPVRRWLASFLKQWATPAAASSRQAA
jgi:GMP synthase (glutamine-hydrolysing)